MEYVVIAERWSATKKNQKELYIAGMFPDKSNAEIFSSAYDNTFFGCSVIYHISDVPKFLAYKHNIGVQSK